MSASPQSGVVSTAILEEVLKRVIEDALSKVSPARPGEGGDSALGTRVGTLETKLNTLDKRVTDGFAKIDESLKSISERQEQTTHAIETRLDETLKAVTTTSELLRANTTETLRLVNLTNLAPNHRIKMEASAEERRVFLTEEDFKEPAKAPVLDQRELVRVIADSKTLPKKKGYVVIQYVGRKDGQTSNEMYLSDKASAPLY